MYKKKPLFITFEGIEGSGKSYQSLKLLRNLKREKLPTIFTREPGGSIGAETIRKILFSSRKNNFSMNTDTLLYLAARSDHLEKTIIPAIKKKKIIICDRFYDSTLAYQVYGNNVSKSMVDVVHNVILNKIKPDLTFILKVKISKAFKRLKKRKKLNRYDKFSKDFYFKVQQGFLRLANTNKKRYIVIDNSEENNSVENKILDKILKILKK
jgi:dTMP kinase